MKRPGLTIRDLLWLVLVLALAIGWWADQGRIARIALETDRERQIYEVAHQALSKTQIAMIAQREAASTRWIQARRSLNDLMAEITAEQGAAIEPALHDAAGLDPAEARYTRARRSVEGVLAEVDGEQAAAIETALQDAAGVLPRPVTAGPTD